MNSAEPTPDKEQNTVIISEKKAMAGIFASSIAHDMNNALTKLKGHMFLLQTEEGLSEDMNSAIKHIAKAVDDLTALAKQLADAGKEGTPGAVKTTELVALLRTIEESINRRDKIKGCSLVFSMPSSLHIQLNEQLFQQMIYNLVINAADALQGRGKIQINVQQLDDHIDIEVHDSGPGIPEGKERTIFSPFYSTKEKGAGLGLLSVKACVQEHNGQLSVTKSNLGGACFRVSLPVNNEA